MQLGGASKAAAAKEAVSCGRRGRLIYYAGWADKYEQVLGNVNPVAAPYFNFTVTEPMGIVGVLAPDEAPLLALVSLLAPAITSGNTVVALASSTQPYPAIVLFGEDAGDELDLPGGVVNLLTGYRKELVPTFATHTHLRAVVGRWANADERKALALAAADSTSSAPISSKADMEKFDWYAGRCGAEPLRGPRQTLLEYKTYVAPDRGRDRRSEPSGGGLLIVLSRPRIGRDLFLGRHRRRGAELRDRQRGHRAAMARGGDDDVTAGLHEARGEAADKMRRPRRSCRRRSAVPYGPE